MLKNYGPMRCVHPPQIHNYKYNNQKYNNLLFVISCTLRIPYQGKVIPLLVARPYNISGGRVVDQSISMVKMLLCNKYVELVALVRQSFIMAMGEMLNFQMDNQHLIFFGL